LPESRWKKHLTDGRPGCCRVKGPDPSAARDGLQAAD